MRSSDALEWFGNGLGWLGLPCPGSYLLALRGCGARLMDRKHNHCYLPGRAKYRLRQKNTSIGGVTAMTPKPHANARLLVNQCQRVKTHAKKVGATAHIYSGPVRDRLASW